ncbi:YIP1 family protein [Patescibacteria group bacterium AH-259-L07]|nr:YIP1 family protein [Patescibacteria group bacterium AH-259-L07]
MEDKKLNFDLDFLEKEQEKSPLHKGPKIEEEKEAGAKPNFREYLKSCFRDFPAFCDKYLRVKNPPYLFFIIWATGAATAVDRMSDFGGSGWLEVWAIVAVAGIVAGYLQYWIGGAIYHLRVKWSKGGDNFDASRNIYMFSGLPLTAAVIASLFLNTIIYGNKYFEYGEGTSIDILFFFVIIAALIYSIRLSYQGVMFIQKTEKTRAMIWFVVLPAIFYVLIFSAAIFSEL